MKLRVRINKQTSRLELDGDEPKLSELSIRVRDELLPRCGLTSDVEFSLSLNGTEVLLDTGQTLSSCGVVSGDMITVLLPQSSHETSVPETLSRTEDEQVHTQTDSDSPMSSQEGPQQGPAPPLLCCETEGGPIPHALERLLDSCASRRPSDCLMLAVHLLMLETGFLPQDDSVKAGEMPIGWRATGGVSRLQYSHPLLEKSLVSLVCVPMGQTLVLNAVLKMDTSLENTRKLVLKPDDYVTVDQTVDSSSSGGAGVVFRDLHKLSRLFRDQLVYPLMAAARQALGLPALFGLAVLPPELLLRVLRLLDVSSLLSLSAVCRHLNTATHDPSLWRHLLHRDFRVCFQYRDTDWKELYKKEYAQRRKQQRRSWCPFYPPIVPPIYPLSPVPSAPMPMPIYPPGIIGGDYDQTPVVLPRPRFDPIGPLPGHLPGMSVPIGRRNPGAGGSRGADVRRGFI